MPIAVVEVPRSELDRFRTFSQYIEDGDFDAGRDAIPQGYAEYAVTVQHDPERRVLFPPLYPTMEIEINGQKTIVLVPEVPKASATVDSPKPKGGTKSPRKQKGKKLRSPSSQKWIDEKNRTTDLLLERFSLDTKTSEPNLKYHKCNTHSHPTQCKELASLSKDESVRDEHVTVQKRVHAEAAKGDVTEHPAKAAKYGNMVLDNRSKDDETPETPRNKVKRPRPTEGPKDPKGKTRAPPAEVPVASSSTDVTMGTSVIIAIVVIISLTILFLEGNE